MKKVWLVPVLALLLSGCGGEQALETVEDDMLVVTPTASEVVLSLPQESELTTYEGEDGSILYFCEDFSVCVQTLPGGDLARSVKSIAGLEKEALTVMKTNAETADRYTCVWCAAGEGTEQICRAVILDDGAYHYTVTVMAEYQNAQMLQRVWQQLLSSVTLSTEQGPADKAPCIDQ